MWKDEKTGENLGLGASFDASASPIVTVDVEKYQSLIDDPSLTQEQKEEFLQALWSIIVSFVELGFGVHPLQEVCGQDSGKLSQQLKDTFDQVRSEEIDET